MVLRKPYAFLIKHFMLIHIILSGLMIYVCIRFNNIFSFIKDYINNVANVSNVRGYFDITLYLGIIISIGISVIIFLLMRYKNKPKTLYLVNTIYYIILLVVTFILASVIISTENNVLGSKTIRLCRDVTRIANWAQYVFIIMMIVRTLGFDIKKFDFVSDIKELSITNEDNEEFELNVGLDSNKILRNIRRSIRELGYYYKENKLVINLLFIVLIVIIVGYFLVNRVTNKLYNENSIISTDNFEYVINSSYVTKLSYDSKNIDNDDKTYVVVDISIKSKYDNKYVIDTSDFTLKVDKKTYFPTLKYYDYFSDIGMGYTKQKISTKEVSDYILIYRIDSDSSNKELDYHTKKYSTKSSVIEYLKRVKLKTMNLDNTSIISTNNVGEELKYSNTIIGDGSILINNFNITSNTNYEYEKCKKVDECSTNSLPISAGYKKVILELDVSSKINNYNIKDFADNFISIHYLENDKEKVVEFKNKTPSIAKDKLYLEVNGDMEFSNTLWLELRIRNNIYKYYLKNLD